MPSKANQEPDTVFIEKARALRPFYFNLVVWGERYVDFLCNFCIPALLSPNNIPALLNSGNKFLIATTDEDWARMRDRPIFQLLKRYVEPVFLRIPPCPPETVNSSHMGIGHKLATQMTFEDRAYGVLLTPDLMVSDGTIAAVQRHAVNGVQVVLCAALRFGEEPLFEHLKQMGVISIESRFGDEARPLTVTSRQLVWAGIRSFHSEVQSCEWDSPYFPRFQIAVWWRVPREDGIILHSGSWAPLLVDYGALKEHDTSMMDNWTIDGDYVFRNFGLTGKVHVVRDSDEMILVSWGPLSDRAIPLEPLHEFTNRFSGEWEKGAWLYKALEGTSYDPLKREIFKRPVYWHTRDINQERWDAAENRALHLISKYGLREGLSGHVIPAVVELMKRVRYGKEAFLYYWKDRHAFSLAIQSIKGDPVARKRVKHGFKIVKNRLLGK